MHSLQSNTFLNTADKIGVGICNDAYWSGNRCNWVGRYIDNTLGNLSNFTPANRALGPELYDGSSGIALFLAYLYIFTNREDFARTADGAIMHALSHIEEIPLTCRFSFYVGLTGIAYAAAKIGLMLNENRLIEKAFAILRNLVKDDESVHLMDIISGNAGAIPVLLELYEIFHENYLINLALKLGDELIRSAEKNSKGWSWDSRANGIQLAQHNLTGFAHGTAGFGYSLLELYHKTSAKKFRIASEQAFAYENYWFNSDRDNWPDFRIGNNNRTSDNFRYAIAWCHGAPGIGLSRLRAYRILHNEKYMKDVQAALRTTVNVLKENNEGVHTVNYSLCHGLAGLCELLICGTDIFGDTQLTSLLSSVGDHGNSKFRDSSLPWPCGITTGVTPGLMLGLAGIGYFYLRLSDPGRIPPILICSP